MGKKSLAFAFVALLALSSVGCAKLQARDNLLKGQQAFKNAKYEVAVNYFKQAMNLDPDLTMAELYLATAYSQQFIPGAVSPENMKMADLATQTFQSILAKDPNNASAIAGMAFIYQSTNQFTKAREYYLKQTQLDPTNKVPFDALASTDWYLVFNKLDPPPPDEQMKLVDEGIANADKSLAIDPTYDEAMTFKNLLLREKSRLTEDEGEKTKLNAEADDWFSKALETRKKNQEKKNKESGGIHPD